MQGAAKTLFNFFELLTAIYEGPTKMTNCKKFPHKKLTKKKVVPELAFFYNKRGHNFFCKKMFLLLILLLFWKVKKIEIECKSE